MESTTKQNFIYRMVFGDHLANKLFWIGVCLAIIGALIAVMNRTMGLQSDGPIVWVSMLLFVGGDLMFHIAIVWFVVLDIKHRYF
jgi:hypothetical protein